MDTGCTESLVQKNRLLLGVAGYCWLDHYVTTTAPDTASVFSQSYKFTAKARPLHGYPLKFSAMDLHLDDYYPKSDENTAYFMVKFQQR